MTCKFTTLTFDRCENVHFVTLLPTRVINGNGQPKYVHEALKNWSDYVIVHISPGPEPQLMHADFDFQLKIL